MTKERLKSYRKIKLERDELKALIVELEGTLYSPKAQNLDGMPRGGSGPSSTVENAALKHAELLERYRAKEAELTQAMAEIENAIETLEPLERTIIRLHYAQGLTWEEICVKINYSWRQVHRFHSSALEHLKENSEIIPNF